MDELTSFAKKKLTSNYTNSNQLIFMCADMHCMQWKSFIFPKLSVALLP